MNLLDHRAEVVASVARSTCAVDFPDLVAWLEPHLEASAGRSKGAIDRSKEWSETLRGAIRKASASLPRGKPLPQLVAVVQRRLRSNAAAYGLLRAPSLNTIRDEIRRQIETEHTGTGMK